MQPVSFRISQLSSYRARGMTMNVNRSAPKLSDVARVAGVSVATASRALSSSLQVREDTRTRVRQAAEMLGYVAHGAARALAEQRTRTVGAVIPTLNNAIFAKSVNSLQQSLAQASYALLLASHEYDPATELELTRHLLERGIDALVLVGTDHDPALFALLDKFQVPYVLTWTLDPERRHPCIGFDNHAAAVEIARHLLDLGHTRIAMISGLTAHNDRARDRIAGVRAALRSRNIELSDADVIEKPYSFASGQEAMKTLLARSPAPTAVICVNDVHAVGALLACRELGVDVPGQVSITGFDDMDISAHIPPGLTTMRVPKAEMGRAAADYLIEHLAGRPVSTHTELRLQWIVRGSTGPAPHARA